MALLPVLAALNAAGGSAPKIDPDRVRAILSAADGEGWTLGDSVPLDLSSLTSVPAPAGGAAFDDAEVTRILAEATAAQWADAGGLFPRRLAVLMAAKDLGLKPGKKPADPAALCVAAQTKLAPGEILPDEAQASEIVERPKPDELRICELEEPKFELLKGKGRKVLVILLVVAAASFAVAFFASRGTPEIGGRAAAAAKAIEETRKAAEAERDRRKAEADKAEQGAQPAPGPKPVAPKPATGPTPAPAEPPTPTAPAAEEPEKKDVPPAKPKGPPAAKTPEQQQFEASAKLASAVQALGLTDSLFEESARWATLPGDGRKACFMALHYCGLDAEWGTREANAAIDVIAAAYRDEAARAASFSAGAASHPDFATFEGARRALAGCLTRNGFARKGPLFR